MSRLLLDKLRQRRAAEGGLLVNPWGGRLTVALVYPNTYFQGMSNLGVHAVYQLLNSRKDCLCERFFLPDPEDLEEHSRTNFPLVSIESQKPLGEFDIVAFSISFENDYLNLPVIFKLGGIPLMREARRPDHPVVLCGGVCAFMNPEPLAEIMDVFAVGEAEAILPAIVETFLPTQNQTREDMMRRAAQLPGVYLPGCHRIIYDKTGKIKEFSPEGSCRNSVKRQWIRDLDQTNVSTCVASEETEFGSMHLLEVSRGCPRACRFCAAGFIYRPFREHSSEYLERHVLSDELHASKIGLVGAAVCDCDALAGIAKHSLDRNREVSISSVRIDAITESQVSVLFESGHKTLALAPEAGSQRMRDVVNKGISEEEILNAVTMVSQGGILNLKLYFMVGLPTETMDDVHAIVELVMKIREKWKAAGIKRGRLGRLLISVNPFIPKPWTPLQWAAMEKRNSLEKKYRLLMKKLRPLSNVNLSLESLRKAEVQALLARGDRKIAKVLPYLADNLNLKGACKKIGLNPEFYIYRERDQNEIFPWEIIDQGVARAHLYKEYQRALRTLPSKACHSSCQCCGLEC